MATLIDEYRRHAIDHGIHTANGNADGTNNSYAHLQELFISLVAEGKGDELFHLYDDIDPSVQCWAAAHTLEVDESRALAKLAELAKLQIAHVSTDAKYTIQEWKSGALRFLKA